MQGPIKILVIFGTRPEAIKMFPVINALRADARFAVSVCTSGQHREMLDSVLAMASIAPDHQLDLMRTDPSLDQLVAALLVGLGRVMDDTAPDWVLVQGDTATALAGAQAAYHRRIKVGHVEAGLRSGDVYQPWPEEANRRLIGTVASLHFAPTRRACSALAGEGVDLAKIHLTGNPGIDALHWVRGQIAHNATLAAGLEPVISRFAGKRILAVTTHRRENWGQGLAGIAAGLRALAARDDVAVIAPLHPSPPVRNGMGQALAGLANVALLEPLDYPHFVRLLSLCHLVLTDSGGVQEEAPALGKPVLVLRDKTERQEGVEAGTARLVGTDPARIAGEAFRLLDDAAAYAAMAQAHNPFGDGKAALRIARSLAEAA